MLEIEYSMAGHVIVQQDILIMEEQTVSNLFVICIVKLVMILTMMDALLVMQLLIELQLISQKE